LFYANRIFFWIGAYDFLILNDELACTSCSLLSLPLIVEENIHIF